MWSRTAFRSSAPRSASAVRRLSTIGGLLLAVVAATAGPASAAASDDITVALSPSTPLVAAVVPPTAGSADLRDVTVGYGGALTVQLPPQLAPGSGTVFGLNFYEPSNPSQGPLPGQQWYYSSAPGASQPGGVPLAVSDLGGSAFRIDIPPVSAVDGLHNDHFAIVTVDGLTSNLPGATTAWLGGRTTIQVYVSTAAPASASVSTYLRIDGPLPRVGVTSDGTIRLKLPPSSVLQQAGMTSLVGAQIRWGQHDASNAQWPVTTSVSADGRAATVRIPGTVKPGHYDVWVSLDRPDLNVQTYFDVDLSAPIPAVPAVTSTSAAPPVTTPPPTATAPTTASAHPAADGVAAAASPQAELRPAASSRTSWALWTGIGVAVLAVAGGAAFLIRRRVISR